MKKQWNSPVAETVAFTATEQGKKLGSQFDEVRVDQNGNYWRGFASGNDVTPVDGKIFIIKEN